MERFKLTLLAEVVYELRAKVNALRNTPAVDSIPSPVTEFWAMYGGMWLLEAPSASSTGTALAYYFSD